MVDDSGCTAVAASMARIGSAAEAAGLAAVAELALRRRVEGARRGLSDDECDEYSADGVGALLRMSRPAARGRVALALDLVTRRPATLASLTRRHLRRAHPSHQRGPGCARGRRRPVGGG